MKKKEEIFIYQDDRRFGFWDRVLHFMEVCRKEFQGQENITDEVYVVTIKFEKEEKDERD